MNPQIPTDASHAAMLNDLRQVIDRALSRLKSADRDAIVLRFFSEKSVAEIATTMNVSEETLRKRLQRALSKLQRHLAKLGIQATPAILPQLLHESGLEGRASMASAHALRAFSGSSQVARDLTRRVASHAILAKLAMATSSAALCAITFLAVTQLRNPQATAAAPTTGSIYQANLNSPIGDEWSSKKTDLPPTGAGGKFLGQYTIDPVTLTLNSLPKHQFLRLDFDILILFSCDGSGVESPKGSVVGPDTWTLQSDGRMIIWQTFSNTPAVPGFAPEVTFQNYPSPVPGDKFPAQTGASEKQTLGYVDHAGPGFPMDSVYHISIIIPHSSDDVKLTFSGIPAGQSILQRNSRDYDESWGLRNVKVETLTSEKVKLLNEPEARATLETAIGPDAMDANNAYWQLARGGDAVHSVMREALAEVPVNHAEAKRIIAELLSARGIKIKESTDAFAKIGILGETDLWYAIEHNPRPPVARRRLDPIVRALSPMQLTDRRERRAAVAARVLEIIGD